MVLSELLPGGLNYTELSALVYTVAAAAIQALLYGSGLMIDKGPGPA